MSGLGPSGPGTEGAHSAKRDCAHGGGAEQLPSATAGAADGAGGPGEELHQRWQHEHRQQHHDEPIRAVRGLRPEPTMVNAVAYTAAAAGL